MGKISTILGQNKIVGTLIDTDIPYTFLFHFFFCLPKVKDQRKFDTGKHDWHDLDSLDSLTPNVVSDIDVFLVLWP